MKAQFKYAFISGFHLRGAVFVIVFTMILVFGVLGSFDLLPFAAHITAISLGGVGIAAVAAVNVISDVQIARRMFSAPGAYLYALTPAPRRQMLGASLTAMFVLDVVSMAAVITGEIWLSMNWLRLDIGTEFSKGVGADAGFIGSILLAVLMYLLIILIILFSVAVGRSLFYKKAASGFLAFALACGCLYASSLLSLLVAPFGVVNRYGPAIMVTVGSLGAVFYILLLLLQVAGLFIVTSKLLERKINI